MTAVVGDGVRVVGLPLPHGPVVSETACYLIEDADAGIHLVDPGWDTDDNLARLERALAEAGRTFADVRSIVATHAHPDHLGLADRLRAEHGIPIALHRVEDAFVRHPTRPDPETSAERWGVPLERRAELAGAADPRAIPARSGADVVLEDGDRLDIPGREVRVVATPGHTAGSICLHDATAGLFFSGDHVLPGVNSGLGIGGFAGDDDVIAIALASYERVAAYDADLVLPGHGAPFAGLASRSAELIARHRRRTAEIAAAVGDEPNASIWMIASRSTWTGGWESLPPLLRLSALAQTEYHLRFLQRAGGSGHTPYPEG